MKHHLLKAALFLLFICAHVTGAQAQAGRMDSIVVVEATGSSATEARDVALAKGEIEGFRLLLQRLDPTQADARIATTPESRIHSMVKGMEVMDEKFSATTYRAKLRITYDDGAIGEVLSAVGATSAAASMTSHVLVLPVLKGGGVVKLWEDGNPWRDIWNSVGLEVGRGVILLPYGDQNDKDSLDAFTATTADYNRMMVLAARYGADQIVVAEAMPVHEEGSVPRLEVKLRRLSVNGQEETLDTYTAQGEDTTEVLMVKAAKAVAATLKGENTPGYSNVSTPGGKQVMVLAAINDITQWTDLRQRLLAMSPVEKLELKAISSRQVDLILHYRGDPSTLISNFEAQAIAVNPVGEYWTISVQ